MIAVDAGNGAMKRLMPISESDTRNSSPPMPSQRDSRTMSAVTVIASSAARYTITATRIAPRFGHANASSVASPATSASTCGTRDGVKRAHGRNAIVNATCVTRKQPSPCGR